MTKIIPYIKKLALFHSLEEFAKKSIIGNFYKHISMLELKFLYSLGLTAFSIKSLLFITSLFFMVCNFTGAYVSILFITIHCIV